MATNSHTRSYIGAGSGVNVEPAIEHDPPKATLDGGKCNWCGRNFMFTPDGWARQCACHLCDFPQPILPDAVAVDWTPERRVGMRNYAGGLEDDR